MDVSLLRVGRRGGVILKREEGGVGKTLAREMDHDEEIAVRDGTKMSSRIDNDEFDVVHDVPRGWLEGKSRSGKATVSGRSRFPSRGCVMGWPCRTSFCTESVLLHSYSFVLLLSTGFSIRFL